MQIVVAVMSDMNACVNQYHTMSKHFLIDMIGINLASGQAMQIVVAVMSDMNACVNKYHTKSKHCPVAKLCKLL